MKKPLSDERKKCLTELKNKVLADPGEEFRLCKYATITISGENYRSLSALSSESSRRLLSTLEDKYSRFLKPEIKLAIMNILDSLDDLVFQFNIPRSNREVLIKPLENIMVQIILEIKILRDNGIDIGF